MVKKRIYRAARVNQLELAKLESQLGAGAVVGIDVAKRVMFAALRGPSQEVVTTVKWNHPDETPAFIRVLKRTQVDKVALESTGTYGDTLRAMLLKEEIEVFQVSANNVKHMSEVYDGVNSSHDGKAAAVIAKLHADGRSHSWPLDGEDQRKLKALVGLIELHDERYQRMIGRLEARLTRHWPELPTVLDLTTATILEVLVEIGGPQEVAGGVERALAVMRKCGGRLLADSKIRDVVTSAQTTVGIPMIAEELMHLQAIAQEAKRSRTLKMAAVTKMKRIGKSVPSVGAIAEVVGWVTAGTIVALLGEPGKFGSASAFEKAAGLNLKERSSGKYQGPLHITKRGSGQCRKLLYMAAIRFIRTSQLAKAWFARKVERDGGRGKKGIVALMRKLIKALWHVGQGVVFDDTQLFDASRLQPTEATH